MTVINIYDIWQKLMSLCNVQQNGQIRPQTDFQNWYNTVNTEMFHAKAAKFQLGQQVTDELSPFLSTVICPVINGYVQLPADYEYIADLRIIRQKAETTCSPLGKFPVIDGKGNSVMYTDPDYAKMIQQYASMGVVERSVTIIDNQRWAACLDHARKGPTWDNPKATQNENGFKIAPKMVQGIVMDYFHTPQNAVFAYTISAQDIVIYNSAGSTQLEWTNVIENEFLTRLAMKYASAIGDNALYSQFENNLKLLV